MDLIAKIKRMEHILDELDRRLDDVERSPDPDNIRRLKYYQRYVRRLEDFYRSDEWKIAYDMDQSGKILSGVKRGVLSEDGIFNALERNKDIMTELKQ